MTQTVAPQTDAQQPAHPAPKFSKLAWSAVILGIVGMVGSQLPLFNNLTAIAAGVGGILGLIALFGTRKLLAAIGVALCVGAIVFTVRAQQELVEEINKSTKQLEQEFDQIEKDMERDLQELEDSRPTFPGDNG